jgi:hypothetical protein
MDRIVLAIPSLTPKADVLILFADVRAVADLMFVDDPFVLDDLGACEYQTGIAVDEPRSAAIAKLAVIPIRTSEGQIDGDVDAAKMGLLRFGDRVTAERDMNTD